MNDRTELERKSYRPSVIERFWSKVDQSGGPDSCWPWSAYTDSRGYGNFRADTIGYLPHRWLLGMLRSEPLSWESGSRESACHRCDNPPCCNPDHLYVGTPHTNIVDSVDRGRHFCAVKTHCKWGHPLSGANLYVTPGTGSRSCRTCRKYHAQQNRLRRQNA